jgi:hypothetical protein
MEVIVNIIVLYIFWKCISQLPYLNKYTNETKFSLYRSLMCLTLAGFSLENSVNNFKDGFIQPFIFKDNNILDIHNVFLAYIIFDILKLLKDKNKRMDLYIHHIWCLASFLIAKKYDHCGYFHSLLLFNEIISVVSGIDSMAMEDNNMLLSAKCKKFRKNIIRYFRLPIWISLFLIILKFTPKLPRPIWWNGILTTLIMIYLDRYWEKKCDKILEKYNL